VTSNAAYEKRPGTATANLIALGLVLVAFVVLFWSTFVNMAQRWEDPTFSHGWVVVPAALVFIWVKRKTFEGLPVKPSWWGLVIVLLGVLSMLMALWADVKFLPFLSVLVVVAGIIVHLLGWQWFIKLIFPYSFLFFMVPWPDFLLVMVTGPMQILTATYSAFLASLIGVGVFSEGVNLHMTKPDGTIWHSFEVAVACSGMRSMVALMCLAAGFAYFTEAALWKRWLLFLLGAPLAVIANILRVFGILCIGNWISVELASKAFHDWSSPVLFLFCTLGLMAIRDFLMRKPKQHGTQTEAHRSREVEDDVF